jgi:uncharacterized protein with HEPN domain
MWRDAAYLLDIVLAAERAIGYTRDLSFEQFSSSNLVQDAVIRVLAIVGEAATRVSPETKAAHPDIPWAKMTGARNRIVHEYDAIDLAVVWGIVRKELPALVERIRPLLPPETGGK